MSASSSGSTQCPISRRWPTTSRPTSTASWSDLQAIRIKTAPREKPERVKPQIVREHGFKTIHLLEEMIAEFEYRPTVCEKSYRVIALRKRLGIDQGQMRLFEEYRYFFYITNDRTGRPRRSYFRPMIAATRRT